MTVLAAMGIKTCRAKCTRRSVHPPNECRHGIGAVVKANLRIPVLGGKRLLRTRYQPIGNIPVVGTMRIGGNYAHAMLIGIVVRPDKGDIKREILRDVRRHK